MVNKAFGVRSGHGSGITGRRDCPERVPGGRVGWKQLPLQIACVPGPDDWLNSSSSAG
jgi:hypothetical protein